MSRKTGATTRPPSHGATPHVTAPFSPTSRPTINPLLRTISIKEEDVRYDMDHRRRGRALVINNMHFSDQTMNRGGTDKDVLAMQPVLEGLGFEVRSEHDLKEQVMLHVFQEEVKKDHTDEDCFLCVLMSHGDAGDVILGSDGKLVELRALVDMLGGSNCPSLLGKPKIFIVVACRGDRVDKGQSCPDGMKRLTIHDAAPDVDTDASVRTGEVEEEEEEEDVPLPFEQDFLFIYSTAEDSTCEKARAKYRMAEDTSDIQSTDTDSPKRRKIQSRRYEIDSDSDEEVARGSKRTNNRGPVETERQTSFAQPTPPAVPPLPLPQSSFTTSPSCGNAAQLKSYLSYREGKEGTHFVQSLSKVLQERGTELEVLQLLTLVISQTAHQYQARSKGTPWHGAKQCPSYVSCLTKALYFPPKHY